MRLAPLPEEKSEVKSHLCAEFKMLGESATLETGKDAASASSSLQLLEGKLLEMNHEFKVIIFNYNGRLFLVSNSETSHSMLLHIPVLVVNNVV